MSMGFLNKLCVCWCCHEVACQVACCIDQWAACEACGLANLECGHCCWKVCYPLCAECKLGDCGEATPHCSKGFKYCLYACVLDCVAPIDGCYACIKYIMDVCGSGVTGFGDILKHTKWLNEKVKNAFELSNGSEP